MDLTALILKAQTLSQRPLDSVPELEPKAISDQDIISSVDYSYLKPSATTGQVTNICQEAIDGGFYGVCVNPVHVSLIASRLEGSSVIPITTVGFPLGANTTEVKVWEAKRAVENGAVELDMVWPLGKFLNKEYEAVYQEIVHVVRAVAPIKVKVILETVHLTNEDIILGSLLVKDAGAAFVKTSTGFGTRGATVEDIKLIKLAVGDELGIKASGGIKDMEKARSLIAAGATRIGTSTNLVSAKR